MASEKDIDRIERNMEKLMKKMDDFIEAHNGHEVNMESRVTAVETKVSFQQRVIWGLIGGIVIALGGHFVNIVMSTGG